MSHPSTAGSSSSLPELQASPNRPEKKHFSIDLSLELERQLELEGSPPTTPSASASSHPHLSSQSLDPQILVHIISGLRKTVEDMTKERDDLLKLLESATTREASLQDTLSLMTEKATDYEEELSAAKKKMKEDEEAITLLRNKVEESRRGLMRLQAESRRQSGVPGSLDLSRAGISGLSSPPSSSKRASFTPLTGRSTTTNNHRRVSSIGGDGNGLSILHLSSDLNPSPNGPLSSSFTHDSTTSSLGPPGSRRSLFLRHSPPNPEIPLPLTSTMTNASSHEVEALKKEVESLKKELSDTRAELTEANEAKEASDMCVKALREFIAENQVGEASSSSAPGKILPPPSMINNDTDRKTTAPNSGWGFKLWKADNTPKATTTSSSAPTPSSSPPNQQTPLASAPFSRLGVFFSSRASVNSTLSSNSVLQTNAALPRDSFRDSISGHSLSVSDTSSVVEPASPENDHPGNVKVFTVPEIGEPVVVDRMIGLSEEEKEQNIITPHVQAPQPAAVTG